MTFFCQSPGGGCPLKVNDLLLPVTWRWVSAESERLGEAAKRDVRFFRTCGRAFNWIAITFCLEGKTYGSETAAVLCSGEKGRHLLIMPCCRERERQLYWLLSLQ